MKEKKLIQNLLELKERLGRIPKSTDIKKYEK